MTTSYSTRKPDFYARRDMSAVLLFTDPNSKFTFPFLSEGHAVHNAAATDSSIALEVSFDGVTVHARLEANGPTKIVEWTYHPCQYIWVRLAAGSPI